MDFKFDENSQVRVTNDLIARTLLMEGLQGIMNDKKACEDFIIAGKAFERNADRISRLGKLGQEKEFLWDALGCYVYARRDAHARNDNKKALEATGLIRAVRSRLDVAGVDEVLMTREKFGGHALVYGFLLRT